MRCAVCDYSSDTESHYHAGLSSGGWRAKRVTFDRRHNEYTCDDCQASSLDALNEMINPDEEYVFNAPDPSVRKKN